jgi:hypothetical protein
MMGERTLLQEPLFYGFRPRGTLEDLLPHLARRLWPTEQVPLGLVASGSAEKD